METGYKFSCQQCGQHLEVGPELIGFTVNCPTCKAPIRIVEDKPKSPPLRSKPKKTAILLCPYCACDFTSRKKPSRRSSFKCPKCAGEVFVEPKQPIYPMPYLSNKQVGYVNYLWQLNHWVFGTGSNKDYVRKKAELGKRFATEPSVGDVIWGLMNESLVKSCQDERERKDVRDLMADFKDFEKSFRKK